MNDMASLLVGWNLIAYGTTCALLGALIENGLGPGARRRIRKTPRRRKHSSTAPPTAAANAAGHTESREPTSEGTTALIRAALAYLTGKLLPATPDPRQVAELSLLLRAVAVDDGWTDPRRMPGFTCAHDLCRAVIGMEMRTAGLPDAQISRILRRTDSAIDALLTQHQPGDDQGHRPPGTGT